MTGRGSDRLCRSGFRLGKADWKKEKEVRFRAGRKRHACAPPPYTCAALEKNHTSGSTFHQCCSSWFRAGSLPLWPVTPTGALLQRQPDPPLQPFIIALSNTCNSHLLIVVRRRAMGPTHGGNKLELTTLTNPCNKPASTNPPQLMVSTRLSYWGNKLLLRVS